MMSLRHLCAPPQPRTRGSSCVRSQGAFPSTSWRSWPLASCSRRSLQPKLRPLLAGGGLQRQASQRAALTVPSDRFLCFIPSCLCSAKRGGLEYLRYFPVAVSLGAKRSDSQTPSRIFGDGQPSHPPCHCHWQLSPLPTPQVLVEFH